MEREQIIRMAWQAGFAIVDKHILADNENGPEHVICTEAINRFAALVAAAERKVIMDSLQKQADLATDALDRRWALEMIAAVAARSNT